MSLQASALYVAGRAAAGALSLLAVSMFARGLGPDGYAWFALASTAAAFAVAVFLQPLQHALARFYNSDAAALPVLRKWMGCLIAGLLVLALLCELAGVAGLPRGMALAAWAIGVAQGVFDFAAQYTSTTLQPARYAKLYVLKALALVVLGSLFLPAGVAGVVAAICAAVAVAVLVFGRGVFARVTVPASPNTASDLTPNLRAFCMPLAVTLFLATVLQWSDRFVLAPWVSKADLGAYAAAGDLTAQTIGFLFAALYLAWYPRMVAAHAAMDAPELARLAQRYALLALAILLPACVGFVLLREAVIGVFFGAAYVSVATKLLPWLALATALAGLRMYFFDMALYLTARMTSQLRNVGIAAIFSVAMGLYLVPRHGVIAAGWVAVMAQVLALLLSVWTGRGVVSWRLNWGAVWPVFTSSALMLAALVLLPKQPGLPLFLNLMLQLGVGLLAYVFSMLAFDALDSRALVRSVLERRR